MNGDYIAEANAVLGCEDRCQFWQRTHNLPPAELAEEKAKRAEMIIRRDALAAEIAERAAKARRAEQWAESELERYRQSIILRCLRDAAAQTGRTKGKKYDTVFRALCAEAGIDDPEMEKRIMGLVVAEWIDDAARAARAELRHRR